MLYHDGCAIVSAGNGNLDIDQKNWRLVVSMVDVE